MPKDRTPLALCALMLHRNGSKFLVTQVWVLCTSCLEYHRGDMLYRSLN